MKAVIVGLALISGVQAVPTIRSGELTPADLALIVSRIPRLAIGSSPALPPSVREAFMQMNCQVPQSIVIAAGQHNVIQGEFAAPGQRDWAALCSDGTVTQIRVVWGGASRCDDRVAATQDTDTLISAAPGVFVYSRSIATASARQVERLLAKYRTTLPEEPGHDAIEDRIEGVATARYCANGQWLSVP